MRMVLSEKKKKAGSFSIQIFPLHSQIFAKL